MTYRDMLSQDRIAGTGQEIFADISKIALNFGEITRIISSVVSRAGSDGQSPDG